MNEINNAWKAIEKKPLRIQDNYYGDGHTSEKIVKHIEDYLYGK